MKEDEATNSCESAVLIAAAIIADSRIPAIKPGNKFFTVSIKILSCVPPSTSAAPIWVLRASSAITTAAPRVKITQIIATVALFFTSFALRMLINLTKMWGMPK